jgi:hypothetical protein
LFARNVADAVSGGVAANFASNNSTSMMAQKSSDFVWAVRLTKIWKDALGKDWEFRTISKGATFSDEKGLWKDEVQQILAQELSEMKYETLDLPNEEGVIVF